MQDELINYLYLHDEKINNLNFRLEKINNINKSSVEYFILNLSPWQINYSAYFI